MLNTLYAVYFIGSVTSLSHLRLFVHQSVCHNYLKGREVTLPISEFFFMTYTHKHTFTNTHRRGKREQKRDISKLIDIQIVWKEGIGCLWLFLEFCWNLFEGRSLTFCGWKIDLPHPTSIIDKVYLLEII